MQSFSSSAIVCAVTPWNLVFLFVRFPYFVCLSLIYTNKSVSVPFHSHMHVLAVFNLFVAAELRDFFFGSMTFPCGMACRAFADDHTLHGIACAVSMQIRAFTYLLRFGVRTGLVQFRERAEKVHTPSLFST